MKKLFIFATLLLSLSVCTGCGGSDDPEPEPTPTPTPTPTPGSGTTDNNTDDKWDTPDAVRYKSFEGLVMTGYQAWYNCAGDWTKRGWVHLQNSTGGFKTGATCVDFWPDMSEYTKTYDTPLKLKDGSTAQMYSSADPETIDLHFKWMKQYGIDGAIIQRFKSAVEYNHPSTKKIIGYALEAAKKYDRAVMIEYDLSGLAAGESVQKIIDDWNSIVEEYHLNDPSQQPNYLWTHGKPMVGFYGIDLANKGGEPSQYFEMFDKMIGRDGKAGGCSFMAGCGYYWLTEGSDAKSLADWTPVLERCSVISPWAVGRYSSKSAFTAKYDNIKADLAWCNERGIIYAPVAFPGFSWANMHVTWTSKATVATFDQSNPYDACPRLKGEFMWTQLAYYVQYIKCPAIFIAMFDEMDEGTCIFKCAHEADAPVMTSDATPWGQFVYYDDDLPSGYYLHLAGSAAKWLKGATGYSGKLPEYVEPE